jgi:hypothetical protein
MTRLSSQGGARLCMAALLLIFVPGANGELKYLFDGLYSARKIF